MVEKEEERINEVSTSPAESGGPKWKLRSICKKPQKAHKASVCKWRLIPPHEKKNPTCVKRDFLASPLSLWASETLSHLFKAAEQKGAEPGFARRPGSGPRAFDHQAMLLKEALPPQGPGSLCHRVGLRV